MSTIDSPCFFTGMYLVADADTSAAEYIEGVNITEAGDRVCSDGWWYSGVTSGVALG